MENDNITMKKDPQGASCNAKVSFGFYVFLGLIAIIGTVLYFIFWS
jgi:hypothetical protein